jgi:adenosylhomocysteine nucleosidase
MLGIIGAMDVEIDAVKAQVKNPQQAVIAGCEFVCGSINGAEVCVARCYPGKVNAALCTQAMIDNFGVSAIINLGICCSLGAGIEIKNIVIASEVCQYDFDTSAVDGVKGLAFNNTVKLPADKALSDALFAAAQSCGAKVHRGCIASGDTFIASQDFKDEIASDFGAICGEMEGGAIGHVCCANEIPFAVLRSVSDGGNDAALLDYPTFKHVAAAMSSKIILKFLEAEK